MAKKIDRTKYEALRAALARLADASESLQGSDAETNPQGYASDEVEYEAALKSARALLAGDE